MLFTLPVSRSSVGSPRLYVNGHDDWIFFNVLCFFGGFNLLTIELSAYLSEPVIFLPGRSANT